MLLLKEYLCSGDIDEATLCLKELEVPHFHHELVYEVSVHSPISQILWITIVSVCAQAVIMVIESMHEKTEEAMCKLLQSLFRSFVITIEQMRNVRISGSLFIRNRLYTGNGLNSQGFERVYDFMPEIAIDVPAAYSILERFVTRCRNAGVITDELVRKMPSRGRKRFVSEGDGGRIKENW